MPHGDMGQYGDMGQFYMNFVEIHPPPCLCTRHTFMMRKIKQIRIHLHVVGSGVGVGSTSPAEMG